MITSQELGIRLSELAEQFKVTGTSAALWHDGSLACAQTGTVNVSTGVPVRPDTLFAAGSVTKVFTSSLAMTLVDEGRLALESRVLDYLPGFATTTPDRSSRITVRMLLNHSSGLPGNYMPDLPAGPDVLERLMQDLTTLPVTGTPGRRWSYSNIGMSTLGRLVEVITGEDYETALRTRILEPLGLNATEDAEELVLRSTAVGHAVDPRTGVTSRVPRLRLGPENGPAGSRLWVDIDDMIRIGRLHIDGTAVDGRRVLTTGALEQMRVPQFEDFWGCFSTCVNYGLGWSIVREGDDPVLSHGGANLGMHSALFVIPKQKVVLAVLTNSRTGSLLHSTLSKSLLQEQFDIETPTGLSAPIASVDVALEPFVGRYDATDGSVLVEARDGQLYLRRVPDPKLAEWESVMGSPGGGDAVPLRCIDSERRRFYLGSQDQTDAMPVQFFDPGQDGRPTLIRVAAVLHERTP